MIASHLTNSRSKAWDSISLRVFLLCSQLAVQSNDPIVTPLFTLQFANRWPSILRGILVLFSIFKTQNPKSFEVVALLLLRFFT